MSSWEPDRTFDFTAALSTGQEATHTVHVRGHGPPILLLQELPGIGPETLDLVDRLTDSGFRVYLPHLFGSFGKVTMTRNALRMFCIRREFNVFLKGRQSPISTWMRALCRHIRSEEDTAGVGVIGMCLTGSFALALMADDAVLGGVASQPALPLFGRDRLHMSEADIAAARVGMESKGPGLAMRYTGDGVAPARLMRALERAFGEDLQTVEFPGKDHSLLTLHFHDPAYHRVEAYFRERFAQV
ncbi:dienelactone hydrolase family protein [Tropicibacter sp. Alg240-R139]|uniref:dienelactone hydrolase family protein n=1 Tax=Tropicibacter sp. Alg240-R139 TaxID=2305991 RepID=UPI0013DF080E|nr:dienelactone hydrolase family protein [Tropicibacter sp. Alg240-R139]